MHKRKPFTLIELLIVIAVILILVAMLMPALYSARRRARRLVCMNNVRNVVMAFHTYAADNRSTFPTIGAGTGNHNGAGVQLYYWRAEVADSLRNDYLGGDLSTFRCPSWLKRQINEYSWSRGLRIYPGVYRRSTYIATTTVRLTPGYAVSEPTADFDGDGEPDDLRTRNLKSNPNLVLVGETIFQTEPGIWEFGAGVPHPNGAMPAGGNFSYVDGHSEWKPFSQMKCAYTYLNGLHDGLRDFYWR